MGIVVFLVILELAGQAEPPQNPVLQALLARGISANGIDVPLPAPALADGQDRENSRNVLRTIAGDDRGVENFVRDSVSAPFVLRTRDVKAGNATIRVADLFFVVRGDLAEIDLRQRLSKAGDSTVEAGNMQVTSRIIADKDLLVRRLEKSSATPGRDDWYTHSTGRLLDRIAVESTDHSVATRTADSLTVATITERAFDADLPHPNRWSTISRSGKLETNGPTQVYPGGGSYVKITNLVNEPGALFVEAHFAFVEPDAWFSGNPILRSKFSVICQDQVRQLRREIQKHRTKK